MKIIANSRVTGLRITSLVAGLVLLAVGSSCRAPQDPGTVIKIGLIATFNGPLAYSGNAFSKGTQMYADEIKDAGGLFDGKTIEIVSCDTERQPQKEVTCVEKLVNKDKVTAIIADNSEGIRSPRAMQTLEKGKVPVMLPIQALPEDQMTPEKAPYLFGQASRHDDAITLINFLKNKRDQTRIGLLHATDLYGFEGHQQAMDAFAQAGLAPVAVESFAVGDTDMTIQAMRLRDSGATSVIVWGFGSDAARAVESMIRIGYRPQIAGPSALFMNTYRQLLQGNSNDTILTMPHAKGDAPVNMQEAMWIFRFFKRYGFNFFTINGKSAPDWPGLELAAYKTIRYLGIAMDRMRSTEGEDIRHLFESGQRFESLGSQVRWSQTSHLARTVPETETYIARFSDGHALFDWDDRAFLAGQWCQRDMEEEMTEARLNAAREDPGGVMNVVIVASRRCFDTYHDEYLAYMGPEKYNMLKDMMDMAISNPEMAARMAEGKGPDDPAMRPSPSPL